MKIGLLIPRAFNDSNRLFKILDSGKNIECLIGATNDSLGMRYADSRGLPMMCVPPVWSARNKEVAGQISVIIDLSDYIVIFDNGIAESAKLAIKLCVQEKKKYKVFKF